MSVRLLDTNNWIALIKGRAPSVMARLESLPASEIAVCSVVKAELWYGAHRYETTIIRLDCWKPRLHRV